MTAFFVLNKKMFARYIFSFIFDKTNEQIIMGLLTSKQVKLTKQLQDDGYKLKEWTPSNQITLKKGKVTVTLFSKK